MFKSEWSFETTVGVSSVGLISCNPKELIINVLQQSNDSKKIEDLQYLKKEFEEILKVKDHLNKYRELAIPLISKLIHLKKTMCLFIFWSCFDYRE